ncbi:MAG TPA: GatB/YqeY domain-containing protein [Candidatus Udaeobacter sp.]|nr:GatB/YqeY domain-containing protein [Candidatus Udaeobacter sp.]
MELKAEIQQAVKAAMKSGDAVTLSTLRLLLSAIQNEEIKVRRALTADEIYKTILTLCKQRAEAIDLFKKGGRDELAQKEAAELQILQGYLPQPLTEDEVQVLIKESISESGAQGIKDLGKVMRLVMPKVTGRTDGKRVNDLAKALLGE